MGGPEFSLELKIIVSIKKLPTFSLSLWFKWTLRSDNYHFFNLVKGNLLYNPVWFITFEKTITFVSTSQHKNTSL